MTADSGTERIARLEAQMAIADLVHAYARAVRSDRFEEVPAMFTDDGLFEIREGHPAGGSFTVRDSVRGRERLEPYYAAAKGRVGPVPLVHNLMITLDGDRATANCVMEGQVLGGEGKVLGEYDDSLRRIEGRWYFAARVYTIFSAASSI